MIVLLSNSEVGTLSQLRVLSLPYEDDPYVGFSSIELATRFCDVWNIPPEQRKFVAFRPGLLNESRGVALFETLSILERYLKDPQTFPCEQLVLRGLRGWLACVPRHFHCFLRRKR